MLLGVPICFPVFGPPPKEPPFDKLAQHGFARINKWDYVPGDDPAVGVFSRFAVLMSEPGHLIAIRFSPEIYSGDQEPLST